MGISSARVLAAQGCACLFAIVSYFSNKATNKRDADHMRHTPGINYQYPIKTLSSTVLFFLTFLFIVSASAQTEPPPVSDAVVSSLSTSSLPAVIDNAQSSSVEVLQVSVLEVSSASTSVESAALPVLAVAESSIAQATTDTSLASSSIKSSVPSSLSNDASSVSTVSVSSAGSDLAAVSPSINSSLDSEVSSAADTAAAPVEPLSLSKFILDTEVKPGTSVRLTWNSETAVGGFSEATPIIVVNGTTPGKTLCLTGAVHGDELNGIEMVRRVVFDIDPAKLTGTIIGVPVANIMGFRRNSRYLPDRRDWNRYFPGNTHGSSASRLAHSFFTKIIMHCDSLVDLHTGSFHRTNLPQLRADLADENVARLAQNFGVIAVLNGRGNPNSLRAAAVRAGIPAVTLEAGEPMAMQREVVDEGVKAINTLLAKTGMYGKQQRWTRIAPVYYRSAWVRANQSGILFSKATLGQRVKEEDVLGTVTDPITNARTTIKSPYNGRIIGMALDQVVLPGFAAYHIGIQTPEAILIEESQLNGETVEEDEEDGDDSGVDSSDEMDEPETGVSKAQDRMADE
jgi:predicted deacylase